jgi:hypothetical protein
MRLAARIRIIASALAITAIAAPAASAQPLPEANSPARNQTTTASQVVRPNPHQQNAQTGGGSPPILRPVRASELPAIKRAQAQEAQRLAYRLPPTDRYSDTEMNAYASAAPHVPGSTPLSNAPSTGFDYGAAAVGAGLTGAIVLLITAGTLTIRRRSQLRTSTTPPSKA